MCRDYVHMRGWMVGRVHSHSHRQSEYIDIDLYYKHRARYRRLRSTADVPARGVVIETERTEEEEKNWGLALDVTKSIEGWRARRVAGVDWFRACENPGFHLRGGRRTAMESTPLLLCRVQSTITPNFIFFLILKLVIFLLFFSLLGIYFYLRGKKQNKIPVSLMRN